MSQPLTHPVASALPRSGDGLAPPLQGASLGDADLVVLALAGDSRAFALIMRRHNRLLFRTARSILGNDCEAEDALQEAYLSAWRALGRFRAESRLSTWLVRIVINEALGRRRRERSGARVIALDPTMTIDEEPVEHLVEADAGERPDHLAMRAQVRRLMEHRIDKLPDTFRTVFMLRAVEEMGFDEIAQALDVPEATVRTRYFRARGLLREGLSREVDVALGDAFSFDGARCDRIVAGVLARLPTVRRDVGPCG